MTEKNCIGLFLELFGWDMEMAFGYANVCITTDRRMNNTRAFMAFDPQHTFTVGMKP
jgi:hypothetical protein